MNTDIICKKLKLELERMLICLILIYYNQMLLYSCIFGLWPMCLGTKVAIRTCLASKLPSGCSSLSETVRRVLRPLDIKVVFHPLHTLCHQLVCPKDPVYQWTNKQD